MEIYGFLKLPHGYVRVQHFTDFLEIVFDGLFLITL